MFFPGIQKLVKNAEQVLQVLLIKCLKKLGKQVRPKGGKNDHC